MQGAPLGITQTTTLGRLTDDTDNRNRNGGGPHPSIVQRGPGDFVVAWVDPDKKIALRQYVHPEDTSQTAINDASRWTTLAGPSEVNIDEPHLVTGPLGTFLMYRHTPNPDSPRETDWYIRRLEGSRSARPASCPTSTSPWARATATTPPTSTPSAAAGPTSSRTRPTGGCTSCGRCRAPPSAGTTCST